jgi:hypothetical protein
VVRSLLQLAMIACVVLLPASARAQASVEVFGGGAELAIRQDRNTVGTGAQVFVPTFGVAVGWRDGAIGLRCEVDLPRTAEASYPHLPKRGPVIVTTRQRNLITSVLFDVSFTGRSKVRLDGVGGLIVVRNQWDNVASDEVVPELPPANTYLGAAGGLDLKLCAKHVVATLPSVRLLYVAGVDKTDFGFAPGHVMLTVGATLGVRF